jgi:hypothetical protein
LPCRRALRLCLIGAFRSKTIAPVPSSQSPSALDIENREDQDDSRSLSSPSNSVGFAARLFEDRPPLQQDRLYAKVRMTDVIQRAAELVLTALSSDFRLAFGEIRGQRRDLRAT